MDTSLSVSPNDPLTPRELPGNVRDTPRWQLPSDQQQKFLNNKCRYLLASSVVTIAGYVSSLPGAPVAP